MAHCTAVGVSAHFYVSMRTSLAHATMARLTGACISRLPMRVSLGRVTPPMTFLLTAVPAPAEPVNTNDGFVGFDSERLKTGGTSTIFPPVWDSGERLLKWALSYARTASVYCIHQVVVLNYVSCATVKRSITRGSQTLVSAVCSISTKKVRRRSVKGTRASAKGVDPRVPR